jgi:hypothetical protein
MYQILRPEKVYNKWSSNEKQMGWESWLCKEVVRDFIIWADALCIKHNNYPYQHRFDCPKCREELSHTLGISV